MYQWVPNEEITAAKLNAMQNRPNMEGVDKNGLGLGGLDDSSLSSDVIDSDGGTWSTTIPKQKIITEHEVGNAKYEYDSGSETWKIRTGRTGVTGIKQVAPANIKWLCKNDLPSDAKKYIWQKINTDSYGNPTAVSMCVNTSSSLSSNTWDPVTGTTGTIWRRMTSIEPNTELYSNPSCKKSWAMKVVNENNTFTLPIARRYGVIQNWDNIQLFECEDVKDRGSSSHWAPVMYGEVGLSNLIQSIGELGGTFIYQTKAGCGSTNDYGIGIASGIEFYDATTYKECYNCHDMRPKSTRACASLGYGASIIIENVNEKHPWQFKLGTTPIHLDIGSLDAGTTANGCVQYSWPEESYLCWPLTPGYRCKRNGVVTGEFRRLCGGYICEGDNGEIHDNHQFAVGEIHDGVIGIRTATWRDPDGKDSKTATTFQWNRQGGVIVGIVEDIGACCGLRPYIDKSGIIHVRSNECHDSGKGTYRPGSGSSSGGGYVRVGVKTNAPLTNSGTSAGFIWNTGRALPPVNEGQRCIGVLNGDVERLTGNNAIYDAVQLRDLCEHFRAGEIKDGKIGIGTSHYAWTTDFDKEKPFCGMVCANSSGGFITGIANDSPCRAKIEGGYIHLPNPEWMGCNAQGVQYACSILWNCYQGSGWPLFKWTKPYNDCTSWRCISSGIVNGKIHSVMDTNKRETAARLPWNGEQNMYNEVGEYKCGRIGLAVATFDPSYDWWQNPQPEDVTCLGCLHYAWNTAGGLIRGIFADITVHDALRCPPYIDCYGNIHIVYIDEKTFKCNDYTRKIHYKKPKLWDDNPPT